MSPEASTHDSNEGEGGQPIATNDDVLKKGDVLGRYLVLEPLGAGAMGVVYAAYDPELDRKIAIKILRPQEGKGDKARRQERLVREAKAMAKLSHPNVGAIYDVGVHGDQVFLAMEFLAGGTLRDWIEAKKRPWREVVRMFIEVGKGLAGAHAEGLIHRDFKPDNVLLDKNGVPKVVDFGLVRLNSALERSTTGSIDLAATQEDEATLPLAQTALAAALTRTGALTGTPAYMAPEQFLGKPFDAKTDQFAFCVSLYEALYGERPFAGDTVIAIAAAVTDGHLREAPKGTEVPFWVRHALTKGLARQPDDRFPNVLDLLKRLETDPSRRRRRFILVSGSIAAALAILVPAFRSISAQRRRLSAHVAEQVVKAAEESATARSAYEMGRQRRAAAFKAFDAKQRSDGETAWAEALAAFRTASSGFARAESLLESVLMADPNRGDLRERLGGLLYEHALLSEDHDGASTEAIVRRFRQLDPLGELARRWSQPGHVSFARRPPNSEVRLERYARQPSGEVAAQQIQVLTAGGPDDLDLAPGSYRANVVLGTKVAFRQVFTVGRNEQVVADLSFPSDVALPEGYVYVPPGSFLFGEADESLRVSFLDTVPIHRDQTKAFLISRDETTFRQWIEFLESQPSLERARRAPRIRAPRGAIELKESGAGQWELTLQPTNRALFAAAGALMTYPDRTRRRSQDWRDFPVSGISADDAEAYMAWLNISKRVPGARLCTEKEWERAARGADGRVFPHGERLLPDDANVDITYSRMALGFGPDVVGSHPASDSAFGIRDLCGNIIEMTKGEIDGTPVIARGGAYYYDRRSARTTNREPMDPTLRFPTLGIRVCADVVAAEPPRRTQ